MKKLLDMHQLSYSYPGQPRALDQIDLSVYAGQTLAVLGGNGAGKSTLFLTMNGVFTPDAGELCWQGQRVHTQAFPATRLRQKVGIVFQDPNDQLFSASIEDDIAFGLINQGLPEPEVRAKVASVIEQLGIAEFVQQPTHALSFGQKKRVALAGILAMEPEIVILDEPTAGLDPRGITEMFDLLQKLRETAGITLVLATHDIDLVALHADVALVLDHGRIVFDGSVAELLSQPDLLRRHALRLPRVAHLMEILAELDGLPVDRFAATISKARLSLLHAYSLGVASGQTFGASLSQTFSAASGQTFGADEGQTFGVAEGSNS